MFSATAQSVRQAKQKYQITTRSQYISPLVPSGFDCSKIRQLGIDRMENFRAGAIMIFCGEAKGGGEPGEGGAATAFSKLVQKLTAPLTYGATDVDLITGTETSPNITQSETFTTANPDNPDQIVVAFNDSRGVNANLSTSPAHRSLPTAASPSPVLPRANGQSPFDNTLGDPVILYNKVSGEWFTVWIVDAQCGAASAATSPALLRTPIAGPIICVHNGGR